MSIRLGEYIIYGELFNKSSYSTHGFLALRGEDDDGEDDMYLRFELTGDCSPDIRGKHIRFEPAEDDGTQKVMPREEFLKLNSFQNGPTGTMTNQGWVRALPCTVEEFVTRSSLGEPPPTEWRNHFLLEWFGQNGRVTVEMAGALVEYCVREGADDNEDDEGDWEPVLNLALPPDFDDPKPDSGPAITRLENVGDFIEIEDFSPAAFTEEELAEGDDLQTLLDAESNRIERAIRGDAEEDLEGERVLHEMKRMDYCLEHEEQSPLSAFIGDYNEIPDPDALSDKEIEIELKSLLARLVMYGVVLDVCEHFSPRDCLRLLLNEIIPDEGAYASLVRTGWVQHFCTWEYCVECEKELEKEFGEMEE